MKRYLDELYMRQASIFELRNIARDLGVYSPTIYKKEDLIEKIMKIISGEDKPYIPKNRKGRPPIQKVRPFYTFQENFGKEQKEAFGGNENLFSQEEVFNPDVKYSFGDANTYCDNASILSDPGFVYGDKENEDNTAFNFGKETGYLKIMPKGSGFIFERGNVSCPDNAIFVSENHIKNFNLKSGDMIKCVYKKVNYNGAKYLTEIEEINGKKPPLQNRRCFENLKISSSKQTFDLKTSIDSKFKKIFPITSGTRNVALIANFGEYDEIISFVKQNFDFKIVNICLEALPENIEILKDTSNCENFYTMLGSIEKRNSFMLSIAYERIKRLSECGENILVVINSLDKVMKNQNFANGYELYDIKDRSLSACNLLLSLARNLEDNESITVLGLMKYDPAISFYKLLKNEFDNLNCNFYHFDN